MSFSCFSRQTRQQHLHFAVFGMENADPCPSVIFVSGQLRVSGREDRKVNLGQEAAFGAAQSTGQARPGQAMSPPSLFSSAVASMERNSNYVRNGRHRCILECVMGKVRMPCRNMQQSDTELINAAEHSSFVCMPPPSSSATQVGHSSLTIPFSLTLSVLPRAANPWLVDRSRKHRNASHRGYQFRVFVGETCTSFSRCLGSLVCQDVLFSQTFTV
jgi:hypothetical protein